MRTLQTEHDAMARQIAAMTEATSNYRKFILDIGNHGVDGFVMSVIRVEEVDRMLVNILRIGVDAYQSSPAAPSELGTRRAA